MESKKLYRSNSNRMIAGVCGGLGKYFSIDPTILRIGVLIVTVATAIVPVIIIYAACALVIPLEPVQPSKEEISLPKDHIADVPKKES